MREGDTSEHQFNFAECKPLSKQNLRTLNHLFKKWQDVIKIKYLLIQLS